MNTLNTQFIDQLSFDEDGLIPAVTQDWLDGAVLMMAWMNRSALEQTLESGEVHYWSRSRKELWHKGSTSGHTQILKGIRYDCDADVLLLTIEQTGSISCHTGARSCFFSNTDKNVLPLEPPVDACSELFQIIKQREANPEPKSYTNKLLAGGENMILKKIGH